MNRYMLRLFENGDIDIITESEEKGCYDRVYHKTFNPSEDVKENLDNAYKEWEKLIEKNYKENN